MPLLASVRLDSERSVSHMRAGVAINNAGAPLGVNFPLLSDVDNLLNLTGNFDRFQTILNSYLH